MTKGEVNQTQGQVRWEPCGQCDRYTRHEVLLSYNVEEPETHDCAWVHRDYEIVRCLGCLQPSFRLNWTSPEDVWQPEEDGELELCDHVEVYPSRVAGRRPLPDEHLLPYEVREIYQETHAAVCNRLRILAGIGIRALVEAVCEEKGADGHNLQQQIEDLVRVGMLTPAGAEILQDTRLLGNRAAHEREWLPEQVLNAAMDAVEHLLTGVYILPATAGRLLRKKSGRSAGASGA